MMKAFFEVLQNGLVQALLYIGFAALLVTVVQRIFSKLKKRKNRVYLGFIQGVLQAVIVIMAVVRIMSLSAEAERFYNTIILSSSVIVVVMGFIFQEGTKNIVHGFFISLYRPFEVGDWIDTVVDGRQIVGYVESMTLRHTVVRNFYNGSLDMIPNSVLDTVLIENANSGRHSANSRLVEVQITYESDLAKAKEILSRIVLAHPSYLDTRPAAERGKPLKIFIADLAAHGITLQVRVSAATIELCSAACSDVREQIYYEFGKAGVEIAYDHLQLLGKLEVTGMQGTEG